MYRGVPSHPRSTLMPQPTATAPLAAGTLPLTTPPAKTQVQLILRPAAPASAVFVAQCP